jgi:hypothetical protein
MNCSAGAPPPPKPVFNPRWEKVSSAARPRRGAAWAPPLFATVGGGGGRSRHSGGADLRAQPPRSDRERFGGGGSGSDMRDKEWRGCFLQMGQGGTRETDLDHNFLIRRWFPRFHWNLVSTGYFLGIESVGLQSVPVHQWM